MNNKLKFNLFVRLFVFMTILVLLAAGSAIVLTYYCFSIPEPEGLSLADWPYRFTDNYSWWLESANGSIQVNDVGLKRLDEYGLWLQILDENGQEVFTYKKPADYPTSYDASDLIALTTKPYANGYTIFASDYETEEQTYVYVIGFPYAIGKYLLYYNGNRIDRLYSVFRTSLLACLGVIFLFVLTYGWWLTKHLSQISQAIALLSKRAYSPLPEKGIFRDVYQALNTMNSEIRHSDQVQQETERMRQEWIANITHDLKTPLSPIKGYAELLAHGSSFDKETVREQVAVILKNVDYIEQLINDLKLVYQLDSGTIPFNPQNVPIARYLKELVIDLINNPAFANRDLEFFNHADDLTLPLDPGLFRRAMENIIINALTHNPPETKVKITVDAEGTKGVWISVLDNGVGMSESELTELFDRYYRGTNTKEKPEGTGLGLAIAKQIITLHGGEITVTSKIDAGTQFLIYLPRN